MNKVAFRWNRPLQLLGLLLIAVLSLGTEAARAQEIDDDCGEFDGCEACVTVVDGKECVTWACPVGDRRGVGILCRQ